MEQDIENVNYDELDDVAKLEYAATLQANVNTVILQLHSAKEQLTSDIFQYAFTLRLNERPDLLARFHTFGQELIRMAIIDKKKEVLNAQVVVEAVSEATKAKQASDIPVEEGESTSPVDEIDEVN
jgi:hypothetical protein